MADKGGSIDLKWVTLFDKEKEKAKTAKKEQMKDDIPDLPEMGGGDGKPAGKKKLSVERIYQKKTQLEHILIRPDTYIGSTEPVTETMWVIDNGVMVNRDVTYVRGLYKIFDEILVNAADNKQRDPKMDCIKITLDKEQNLIRIWNNGKGIPVVEHKGEKMFVPEMIFGHLLTSSNYDDEEKKVTGGRNGYGAKLCNIFSTKFTVITACKEYKKKFKQSWHSNMSKTTPPKISPFDGSDFTEVTFNPDLSKFKMTELDDDTMALLTRRAYDIAGANKGLKVFLNEKRLPVNGFKSYVDLYVKDKEDETGNRLKVIHEQVNPRWEVCVCLSEKGFQQVSFVNSIATTKGGRHVDYVADQIVTQIIQTVKKKNKAGINIKPFQVRSHIWVFVNCLIENPTFDSQTKETMTLQVKKFGSHCKLSEKFIKAASNCGIVENILSWMKFKAQSQLDKKCHTSKHSKIKGVPKLDDANSAGGRNSSLCTLILTEGDSAKSLAVSGLGVVGRDHYGVFPLRGKLLNVREASHKQIMENAEINNIIKILGLQYKNKYDSEESLKTLRYGKLMIMTDQDQDGSHIKGLLINFIHSNWPQLLQRDFLEEFITPIVKVSKANETTLSFYSLPEFERWKNETDNWKTWKVKYYKGLGTSTMKEAKEYFCDMDRHRIPFEYTGPDDDAAIVLAFSKKKVEDRKVWLSEWLEERRSRKETGLGERYLYQTDTKKVSYNEFINKELVLFSNADNERSIPSMVDGLKPGQRKVLYTCFKKYEKKEIKVAQMAGAVAELSAYHHGETSLMSTIINLAQNFVGSNNLNLLQPIGQFGTRLHGGKDAASPRYIFTQLSPLARLVFPAHDDSLLTYMFDDNQRIEPEFYVPIIPMVLINGSEGIGTGWSTRISNYDIREVVANVKRLLAGEDPIPMLPSYKNFRGTIEEFEPNRFAVNGEIAVTDNNSVEITELPVRVWTQNYKESVLETMVYGTEKVKPSITDYKEYHTDTTVKFVVKMNEERLMRAEDEGLHKMFKLQTTFSHANMVLYDSHGCIKRYENVEEILREFFTLRMELYHKRKAYLEGILEAESSKLNNQARFIMEKIDGKVVIENKSKTSMISQLASRGYDSDPVKAWKEAQQKTAEEDEDSFDDTASDSSEAGSGPDYNYLLGMSLWSLTKEKKNELLKQRDDKAAELSALRRKTASMLWTDDLNAFSAELDRVEAQEREDASSGVAALSSKMAKGKGSKINKPRKQKLLTREETKPSPYGRRVVPRIDNLIKKPSGDGRRGRKPKEVDIKIEEGSELSGLLDDDKDSVALSDKPAGAKPKAKTAKPRVPKEPKEPKAPKAPRKPRQPKAPGSVKGKKGAKKSKRNPWSDESEEEPMDDITSGDAALAAKLAAQGDRGPRRAAASAKKKYTYSDEEESDESGDSYITAAARREEVTYHDENDLDDVTMSQPPEMSNDFSDNDMENNSDASFDAAPKKPKKKPAPKKPAQKKPATKKPANAKKTSKPVKSSKYVEVDSDASDGMLKDESSDRLSINSDSDASPVPKPKAKPASKPKKETKTTMSNALKRMNAPKRKKASDSDSDSDPPKPKSKYVDSDSDDDFGMSKAPPKKLPKAEPKNQALKKTHSWLYGSDDDDKDDDIKVETKKTGNGTMSSARGSIGRSKTSMKYTYSDSEDD
ncbi:DNA topoisomerase 2-alpha-like [Lytechinus variegatus]|uniref:DNA topoisomerase 2-alpha-like n=1 Tax=Lytechinus variegatus TaxID=7654 RepID=UPI001BB209BF|nr:DNA topoisomerase 2-alpha-like [Lytechinus variegatus]